MSHTAYRTSIPFLSVDVISIDEFVRQLETLE